MGSKSSGRKIWIYTVSAPISYLLNFLQLNQSDQWAWAPTSGNNTFVVFFNSLRNYIHSIKVVKMYMDKNLNGTTERVWIHCKSHTWPDGHSSLWRLIITKAIMIKGMLLVCLLLSKDGGTNHNIIHSPFFWTFFCTFPSRLIHSALNWNTLK